MRVQGPNAAAVTTTATKTRRSAAAGSFALAPEEGAQPATTAASLRTVGGIDALIALQSGSDEPGAKRRRAVARGRVALDALDELKHGMLAGTLQPSILQRLKAAVTELRVDTGEPGLDAVLREIELRVEVEIAKLTARAEAPVAYGM
jgi:hypothetical protein